MTCEHDLPRLEIVPVERLVLHEHHDIQRTPPLMKKFRASKVLRNPVVVTPFNGRDDSFLVLDGANRTAAFRKLEIPHILVQVLEADDPMMELNSWNHVIWGISPDKLYSKIREIPGINLEAIDRSDSFQELMDIQALASLHLINGEIFTVCVPDFDLVSRVRTMNAFVSRYMELANTDRTTLFQLDSLTDKYEELTGLAVLPPFEISEVMEVVGEGNLMPPGSTRFTIAPRILRINYPLERLEAKKSIEEKNQDLQVFICNLLDKKRVRYYAEPTFIFDE
jgi:hypothetical protein